MAVLADNALTSKEDVKETLGLDSGDTSKDNLIIRKINQASTMIERYCGRNFKAANYTEYLDAQHTDQLVLKNRPINSITSISTRNTSQNINSFTTVESEDYFFTAGSNDAEAGIIDLNYSTWGGFDSVKVAYNAGYTTIPADLSEAAATLASYLVSNPTSATNVKRKTEGQRSIEYFETQSGGNSLFEQLGVDEILNSYANFPVLENR